MKILVLAFFYLTISGCVSTGVVDEFSIAPKGFMAFTSARNFDPPGQIYRVTSDGDVYKVSTLDITPESGEETLQNYSKNTKLTAKSLLELAGASMEDFSAVANADLEKTSDTLLLTKNSYREFLQDNSGIYPALSILFSKVPFREDNRYFLIRETISVDSVVYRTSKSILSDIGVSGEYLDKLVGSANISWAKGQEFTISETFDSPRRLWYKPEEIRPNNLESSGANLKTFDLFPTNGGVFKAPNNAINSP